MSRGLGRVLATLILAAAASILISVNGAAAQAAQCWVRPVGSDPVPVFAETTTSSPQVGTLPSGGAPSVCAGEGGSAYNLCGGGDRWFRVRVVNGYVPSACVFVAGVE